jgi:hypothetical protein
MSRSTALKSIILVLPPPRQQPVVLKISKKLVRAWAMVAAYLAWDARPGLWYYTLDPLVLTFWGLDLSVNSMQATLKPLHDQLMCHERQRVLTSRMRDAVMQWSSVRVHRVQFNRAIVYGPDMEVFSALYDLNSLAVLFGYMPSLYLNTRTNSMAQQLDIRLHTSGPVMRGGLGTVVRSATFVRFTAIQLSFA